MSNRYSYALVLSYYQSRGIIERSASPLNPARSLSYEQATLAKPSLVHVPDVPDPEDSSTASKPKDQPRTSRHSASSVITEIWAPQRVYIPCAQSHAMIETSNENSSPSQCPPWDNSDLHNQQRVICPAIEKGQSRVRSREKVIMRSSSDNYRRRRSYKRLDYEYRDAVQDLFASMQPAFSPVKNTSNYLSPSVNYDNPSSEKGKASQELAATLDGLAIDETELPDSPDFDVVPWEYSPITTRRNMSSVQTEEDRERRRSQSRAQPILSVSRAKAPGTAIDTKSQEQYSHCFPKMDAFTGLVDIETQRPMFSRSWTEDTVFLPTYPRALPASVTAQKPVGIADARVPTEVPRRSTSLSPGSVPLEFHEAEHMALAALAERQGVDEGIWLKGERKGGRGGSSDDDAAPPPIKLRRHEGRG